MTSATSLYQDFVNGVAAYGVPLRLRYYTETIAGSSYDVGVVAQSGTDVYVSGIVNIFDVSTGGDSPHRVEQGFVLQADRVFYVNGSVDTSVNFTVEPSGTGSVFSSIDNGNVAWQVQGSVIYKKLYTRFLPTGSVTGW